MRITNNMMISTVKWNIQSNLRKMNKLDQQLATGYRFNKPSDAPIEMAKTLMLNTDLAEIDQYRRNSIDAKSWLEVTEGSLISIGDSLHRVKQLAVQASNDIYQPEDLASIITEVKEIKNFIISITNSTYQGKHIFSGKKTDQGSLDEDGSFKNDYFDTTNTFQMEPKNHEISYKIGVSEEIIINTTSRDILGSPPTDGSHRRPEIIAMLDDFIESLTRPRLPKVDSNALLSPGNPGDVFIDTGGDIFSWDGVSWVNNGDISTIPTQTFTALPAGTPGQVFREGGTVYAWDGTEWKTHNQPLTTSMPTTGANGDAYLVGDRVYTWDGGWQDKGPLSSIKVVNNEDGLPAAPNVGDMFKSDDNYVVWDGASWSPISPPAQNIKPFELLERIDAAQDRVNFARSQIGGRVNAIDLRLDRLEMSKITVTSLKSQNQDADMAEVIMNLKAQETVYRASLSAGARIIQPTLMDFLR